MSKYNMTVEFSIFPQVGPAHWVHYRYTRAGWAARRIVEAGLYPAADGTYQKTVYHTCNGKRYSTWFTAYLEGTPEQQAAVRAKVNALLSQ